MSNVISLDPQAERVQTVIDHIVDISADITSIVSVVTVRGPDGIERAQVCTAAPALAVYRAVRFLEEAIKEEDI